MGILDVRASVAADLRYIKTTDVVDASSDFAPASALTRITAVESALNITARPATPGTTTQPATWLRADQLTTIANGGSVNYWASATGAGDATPSTLNGGTSPTLVTNVINGRPAVRFNKSAISKMKFGAASAATATNHTFLVVARHPVLANAGFLIHGFNGTSGIDAAATMGIRAQVTTAGAYSLGAFGATGGTASVTATGAVTANTWNLYSVDFTTGSAPTATFNGTSAAAGTGATDTPGTLTGVALGGYGTGSGDVDYAEIIYFSTQLSTADRKTWEQYLAATYLLTVAA